MVAITVILAALIATFVLGLGGTVNQNPQAGVSFDQNYDGTNYDLTTQIVSMENADRVSYQITDKSGDGAANDNGGTTEGVILSLKRASL